MKMPNFNSDTSDSYFPLQSHDTTSVSLLCHLYVNKEE